MEGDMIVPFNRLLDRHMNMDHVQADVTHVSWHHDQHTHYGPNDMFLYCTVL